MSEFRLIADVVVSMLSQFTVGTYRYFHFMYVNNIISTAPV